MCLSACANTTAGSLLLVHGLIDENVHFRHTARLCTALTRARKPYELLAFPELSQLKQLRSLNLYNCHELASLPDVSELKQLTDFKKPLHLE